ncbi:MAG: hypothetical protein KDK53_18435 [Maritimibacter sp.]|nr:hypothetical protein [Maritimibacter sp.]
MSDDDLRAAVSALLDDLLARPEDRALLQAQLRRKIAEMRAAGIPVGAELLQHEDSGRDDSDGEGGDLFDNMPI